MLLCLVDLARLLIMMTQPFRLLTILSLLIALLLPATSIAVSNPCEKPLIGGWAQWRPFQYRDDAGNLTGLDIDIMNALADSMGCQVKYLELPWKRILKMVSTGDVYFVLGATKTAERSIYAYFSDPYRTESVRMYGRAENINKYNLNSLQDIMNYDFTLAVYLGVHYGPDFDNLIQNQKFKARLHLSSGDTTLIELLSRNRFHGALEEENAANFRIKQANLKSVIKLYPMPPITSGNTYIAFSKKHVSPGMINFINSHLNKLKESGTIESILRKYGK